MPARCIMRGGSERSVSLVQTCSDVRNWGPVLLLGRATMCRKPAGMQNDAQVHALRPRQCRPFCKSLFLLLKGSSGAASAGSGWVGLEALLRPGFVHAGFTAR